MPQFKISVIVALLAFSLLSACDAQFSANNAVTENAVAAETASLDNAQIERAFANKQSDIQVQGTGVVVKLLPDDTKGAQHQKFLVKIPVKTMAQQTLLFAHNIDLAPRVPLQVNDTISFNGEYVYNPKGGVMHWSHHDPDGRHENGWIKLHNETYQ